ncbi:cupin domain-containing protein [Acuticoccus mangrovi]|uniref:Cupin domain-containing protein n=1 Tax=Acuticoccus mangrovi TaxID=2796142 RepID=A0A934IQP4_9HYPH|nr:cupin domain-containing protein [Acuticoccus mangrovi]MBJ3775839.1 cupin domain-containing protein [Acuticoccus mangrovi]
MADLEAGVTRAGEGILPEAWDILGQTYTPKMVCESSFTWEALFPPGTFVPPHVHPDQDEFIYVFEGTFDLLLDGKPETASAGDLIKLPRGIEHGIFNKSDAPVKCLFWVSPTQKLYDLFVAIDGVPDPEKVVALAAAHNIHFAPPPAE